MSIKESNHVNFKLQHDSVVNIIWPKYNLPNAKNKLRNTSTMSYLRPNMSFLANSTPCITTTRTILMWEFCNKQTDWQITRDCNQLSGSNTFDTLRTSHQTTSSRHYGEPKHSPVKASDHERRKGLSEANPSTLQTIKYNTTLQCDWPPFYHLRIVVPVLTRFLIRWNESKEVAEAVGIFRIFTSPA